MTIRTVLIVVLALVVGLTAALGVAKYSQGLGAAQAAEETVPVVVAVVDIPRGSTVTADMVKVRDYPKSVAPAGGATRTEDVTQRVLKENVIKDEPVLEARLAPKGTGPGFAHVIPPGMRAISIKTSNAASVGSGFILPGDKVDVVFTKRTLNTNDEVGGGTGTILVQRVEVLAINQKSDPQQDNKMDIKDLQSATLLVSPEQMLDIELAQTLGTLTLVLRGRDDVSAALVPPRTGKNIAMHVGRPWDAQVKDASEALSKAWADMQEANAKVAREKAEREKAEREKAAKETPKEAPKVQPAVDPAPQPLVIRTLRNNVPSKVEVPSADKQ